MNRFLKIFAMLIVAAILLTSFASCTQRSEEEATGEQTDEISQTTDSTTGDDNTSETTDSTTGDDNASETTDKRFDYFNSDLTKYITVDPAIYKNLTLNIDAKYAVTDDRLNEYIEKIMSSFPNIEKVTDRPIAEGDTVYIYYEGYIDGELFSGGSNMSDSEPYPLTIGSGAFIPGFEDGLIGVVPADTSRENPAEVNTKFPDSYHSADVAGKDAIFKVVVEYIEEESLAEFGEDFVLDNFDFDPAEGDVVEQFKALAREDLEMELRDAALGAIYDALDGKFTVHQYPAGEVSYYTEYLTSQVNSAYEEYVYYKSYYDAMGLSFNSLDEFARYYVGAVDDDWQAVVLDRAKLYVEEALFLFGIAHYEGLVVDEERYQESLDYLTYYYVQYYQNYGYSITAAQVQALISSDMVVEHATTELFIDLILAHATINFISSEE